MPRSWLNMPTRFYWLLPLREKLMLVIAYRLPRSIVYWASVRLMCNATVGEYSNQVVPELLAMDALKRWEKTA